MIMMVVIVVDDIAREGEEIGETHDDIFKRIEDP